MRHGKLNILGINAYHGDSSACIYVDGVLVAATEEERFRRIKHWAGLPSQAINFCLGEAGISMKDVDYICVSRDPYAKLADKLKYVLTSGIDRANLKSRVRNSFNIRTLKDNIATACDVPRDQMKAKVKFIEHHRCHMASAFFISPYQECAILSIDGMGDFSSTMRGVGSGNKIKVLDSVSYPHSLGMFYTAFTQLLGFPHYGDEYKLMGLAPYGRPIFAERIRKEVIHLLPNGLFKLVGEYFHHFKNGVSMSWDGGSPSIDALFSPALKNAFGGQRRKGEKLEQIHMDLAASVQKVAEDVIFHMANDLQEKTGHKNLCLTGGVAQNSMANGKIVRNTSFENLFVPPAGHDAGTATGAALYYWHDKAGKARSKFKVQPYTGVKFKNADVKELLSRRGVEYEELSDHELFERVSNCLIDGGVVGWFQNRAEFGPRALGNRSILADPRRRDAKAILNAKIKKRESFRPFAPSILEEHTKDYFLQGGMVPFMEKVFDIRPEKHEKIPAVTHVNGTGRLQTVSREVNERYYLLIERFYEKTGVPVLLNTSFNENEPIVNTPKEALECFLRTKMDILVMQNCLVQRSGLVRLFQA